MPEIHFPALRHQRGRYRVARHARTRQKHIEQRRHVHASVVPDIPARAELPDKQTVVVEVHVLACLGLVPALSLEAKNHILTGRHDRVAAIVHAPSDRN